MANPTPSSKTRFRPGISGNPGGRPPLPPELRGIAVLTADEVRRIISRYSRMNRGQLEGVINAPGTSVLDLSIASALASIAKTGEISRLGFLLDRAVGRPPTMDPTDAEEAADLDRFASMPLSELVQLAKDEIPKYEASLRGSSSSEEPRMTEPDGLA